MNEEKGQSLVEMALITPLLILMFLGVFEVGYALRDQLIIVNTSREAARFATKGQNLVVTDDSVIGYEEIITQSIASAAHQLQNELYVPAESGLIISNIIATVTVTDCANGTYHVIYPSPDKEYLMYKTSDVYESKVDFVTEAMQIGERNRNISCRLLDDSGQPMGIPLEHVVIVEMFYTHHQLLGFPLLSNPLSDPIPLYSKTVMRKAYGRDFVK